MDGMGKNDDSNGAKAALVVVVLNGMTSFVGEVSPAVPAFTIQSIP